MSKDHLEPEKHARKVNCWSCGAWITCAKNNLLLSRCVDNIHRSHCLSWHCVDSLPGRFFTSRPLLLSYVLSHLKFWRGQCFWIAASDSFNVFGRASSVQYFRHPCNHMWSMYDKICSHIRLDWVRRSGRKSPAEKQDGLGGARHPNESKTAKKNVFSHLEINLVSAATPKSYCLLSLLLCKAGAAERIRAAIGDQRQPETNCHSATARILEILYTRLRSHWSSILLTVRKESKFRASRESHFRVALGNSPEY